MILELLCGWWLGTKIQAYATMELRQLKYFITIAQEQSFTKASERLHITQPALSRQIKQLEDGLGTVLFLRTKDGLILTQAGMYLFEQAQNILQQCQIVIQTIRDQYSSTATDKPLIIGYIPTILQSFLGATLHTFGLTYPHVSIALKEMSPSQQVQALRDKAIDIAFMGNPPDELASEFQVQCIRLVPIVVLLPETHPSAQQRSLDLAEFARCKFIGMVEETFPGRNDRIRHCCQMAGFIPNLHSMADTHSSMIMMVGLGQGIAIMPNEAAALPHPKVTFVPLHHPLYYARSTAVWRKEMPTDALAKFLQLLLEQVVEK